MSRKITLLTNEGKNCREDVIATAVNWLGHDFEFLFSEAWGFELLKGSGTETLGERVVVDWGNIIELSSKHCGVKITYKEYSNVEESYRAVVQQIRKGRVAGFTMDAHWCPWTDFFQQEGVHVQGHTILGYDLDKDKNIICVDCLPAHYGVTVPYKYFLKGNNGSTIQFEKCQSEQKEKCLEDIVQTILSKVRHEGAYGNMFHTIRAFSGMFQNIKFEDECKGYGKDDFWNSKLFIAILNAANGRKQFGKVLKIIGQKQNNNAVVAIGDQLNYIGAKWLGIRGCLIKARLVGLNQMWLKRIMEMFEYIASFEEELADKLEIAMMQSNVQTSSQKQMKTAQNEQDLDDQANIKILNLNDYFNNKAFDYTVSLDSKADITGTGDYLLLEQVKMNTVFNAGGVDYMFSSQFSTEYDNISCGSQVIPIKVHGPRKLSILACAEWGDFYEKVSILYADGFSEELFFQLNDWCVKPDKEKTYYMEVKSVSTSNQVLSVDKEPRYLSSIVFELAHDSEAVEIHLPNCPNVHIFSVSIY